MLRMAAAQWRVRFRRTVALLGVIAVAVTAFVLLTAAARTSRLETLGTVQANLRPAYDILVRPAGRQLPLERERDLVQSGQLAGLGGGITLDQWRAMQAIDGVAVAAPVAVVGFAMRTVPVPIDVGAHLRPGAERQLLRVQPTWVTDRGLSRIPDGPAYVYATTGELRGPPDGSTADVLVGPEEIGADGRSVPVCGSGVTGTVSPLDVTARSSLTCLGGPGSTWTDTPGREQDTVVTLGWSVPLLVAAVDPAAEAELAGLDGAVTTGRYLTPEDGPTPRRADGAAYTGLPVLMAERAQVDAHLELEVQQLSAQDAELVRTEPSEAALRAGWQGRPGTPVDRRTVEVDTVYRELLAQMRGTPATTQTLFGDDPAAGARFLSQFWTVGPAHAAADGAGLAAAPRPQDPLLWGYGSDTGGSAKAVPMELADQGVRDVVVHRAAPGGPLVDGVVEMPMPGLDLVGTFDPALVDLGGALSAVPMDTYFTPGAPGADPASRTALGGRALQPNANIAALQSQPSLLLTTLSSLPSLLDPDVYTTRPDYPENRLDTGAPLSVVRIRLAGELGVDAVSRERVRVVAEEIAEATGLQVDITLGSSPTEVTVQNPAGAFGRPALALAEPWVQKGVATVLVTAADRKSVLLAGLVLAVCALAVVNATSAAVRSRRVELGVLACLGWSRRNLFSLLLTEIAGVGLAAGVLGLVASLSLAALLGLGVGPAHALLAVPAALALELLAGVPPVWRAARRDPAAAVLPPVAFGAGRPRSPGRVLTLALAQLSRAPGRVLLGAASLAIGVCALTLLLAITVAFHGTVTGTLLGEAVSLQASTVDHLAVAVIIVLGAVSVADVLYLNIQERAAELALLRAVGWTDASLRRLVTYEALGMGVAGGVVGAALGLAGAARFAGALTAATVWCAVAALAVGVAVAALSVVVPSTLLSRLPVAQLLAEE